MPKRITYLYLLGLLSHICTAAPVPRTPKLPPPSGPYPVGTLALKMTDTHRSDTLAPTPVHRIFMLQVFYPLSPSSSPSLPLSPYTPPHAASFYETSHSLQHNSLGKLLSNSHLNGILHIPIGNTINVIIFSPAFRISRVFYTTILEELASRGWIILAIDHTYDAETVEMEDGELIPGVFSGSIEDLDVGAVVEAFYARVWDVIMVLDAVVDIVGRIPGAREGGKDVEIGGFGVFGHSFGGAVAADVAWRDARVWGALNLDGDFYGRVVDEGLGTPLMYIDAAHGDDVVRSPSQAKVWEGLRGWRKHVRVAGVRHMGFSDLPVLAEALGLEGMMGGEEKDEVFGEAEARRSNSVVKECVAAFFGYLFNNVEEPTVSGELHEEWPEVSFPRVWDF